MPRRKFQKAFVDPISLIGITFLIITLTVGVSATNNPVKKFLIDSLAGGRVKSCDDYGSAAKRNACKDAQEETSDEAVVNQAYRNAHPNQYPVTDSKGNHLSNEQQIEILTKFASTANPDPVSIGDIKAMCPTCNNNTLRNYATNSLNSFYYDKTKINQIEAQYQQEVQAKAAADAAQAVKIAQQKEQARLENIRKTQIAARDKKQAEAEVAAQIAQKAKQQMLEDQIIRERNLAVAQANQKRIAAEAIAQARLAEEQRLAQIVQEQDIERIRLERAEEEAQKLTDKLAEQQKGLQALEDARLEANRIIAEKENKPSYWDTLFHGDPNIKITDLGTTGLGGGNATVLPPPAEVIDTVKNPGGIYKYALENTISFGAGLATATVVTPGAPAFIMETALSNPLVQRVLPYVLWADFADSATAGVQCAASGDASSPACSAAVASVLAPPGAGLADDFADAMSTLRPRSPLNLNPLSGLSGDFSFPTSVADFDMTPSVGTSIDNVISNINPNPTETLTQAINPSDMLFAPRDITNIPDDMARAMVDEKVIQPIADKFDIAPELNSLDTPITSRVPVADQLTDWVSTTRNNITEAWDRNIINGPIGDIILDHPVRVVEPVQQIKTNYANVEIDVNSGVVTRNPLLETEINILGKNDSKFGYESYDEYLDQQINAPAKYYEQYGGQEGIPRFLGYTESGGFDIEYIPGTTLDKFEGILTQTEINNTLAMVKRQQDLTGLAHGDIKPKNTIGILIQTELTT